ncbi:hypothetical protein H476_1765 [[Clostridium] sordellii VPI 9048]|nr:hypothetical protein H476_1765 [[Clostridium] sordellii VPI 9048] [Paeniclostridium sordellii VPI 9048]
MENKTKEIKKIKALCIDCGVTTYFIVISRVDLKVENRRHK